MGIPWNHCKSGSGHYFPYYITIGGWVVKYFLAFLTGKGTEAAQDGYFTGFITSDIEPVILMLIFLAVTAFIVFRGVNKGIESFPRSSCRC